MTQRLPDELRDRIEAKVIAEVDSYYEARKRKLTRALDLEHQQAIEGFKRWLRGDASGRISPPILSLVEEASTLPESDATRNGSSNTLTTRQMMLAVLPELGDTFKQAEIREKILERWPDLDPKALANRISQLLKKMADDGQLVRVDKGPRIQDPWVYALNQNQGERLLES